MKGLEGWVYGFLGAVFVVGAIYLAQFVMQRKRSRSRKP